MRVKGMADQPDVSGEELMEDGRQSVGFVGAVFHAVSEEEVTDDGGGAAVGQSSLVNQ